MNIIGHTQERASLRQLAYKGQTSQSFLFVGPQSVGKRLAALEFASELAGDAGFEPTAEQGTPWDVRVWEPEQHTEKGVTKERLLTAKDAREHLRFLQETPFQGKRRVLVVADAHRLSPGAQNALLKFAEEPAATAALIFVTHQSGDLFDTLRSRLFRVTFSLVPEETLIQEGKAFGLGVSEDLPAFFFRLGRPGVLVAAAENPKAFEQKKEALAQLFRISTLSLAERLRLSERLAADARNASMLLEWFLPGLHAQAKNQQDGARLRRYYELLEAFSEAAKRVKSPEQNARLVLDTLFLAI